MVENFSRRVVILTLTQACNLACVYCFEHNKTAKKMSYEMAIHIIEQEFSELNEDVILEIDLFGGEPFLEFELIKQIVNYVEHSKMKDRVIFFADTNGTLINDEIKKWLEVHSHNFVCGLSYDGTDLMQDMNRCNSSKLIDLNFFQQQYPEQTIKMTISQNSLPHLAEGVIYLQEKGFEVACNLAYGIDWGKEEYCALLERELNKLIEYYLAHPSVIACSMLDTDISGVLSDGMKQRYCGAGIDMATYDVDGEVYPCHLFMPLSVGYEKASQANSIHFFENEIPNEFLDKKCQECVIKSICPTCYGANYLQYGNIYMQDDNYCNLQKIITKARSYFKGLQWKKGLLNLSDEEEHILLSSVLKIQKQL